MSSRAQTTTQTTVLAERIRQSKTELKAGQLPLKHCLLNLHNLKGFSWAHQRHAQQASSRCWSWAPRQAPWANQAGHAKQRPKSLHTPAYRGGSSRCLDRKAPGTPGHWPNLQGGPSPKGPRRLLLSASGAP